MKPKSRIKILTLLGAIILLSLACQLKPLTPEEILLKSKQNMAGVSSYHMAMQITVTSGGNTVTVTAEGDAETPGKAYMIMSMMDQEFEILILSPTEAYSRMSGGTEWTPVDAASLAQSEGFANAGSQLKISDYAANIVKLDDEKIGTVDCYHLVMDVDIKNIMNVINPELASEIGEGAAPSKVGLWVGKKDLLVYKMSYEVHLEVQSQSMDMVMEATFSNFNEPVEIPTP